MQHRKLNMNARRYNDNNYAEKYLKKTTEQYYVNFGCRKFGILELVITSMDCDICILLISTCGIPPPTMSS